VFDDLRDGPNRWVPWAFLALLSFTIAFFVVPLKSNSTPERVTAASAVTAGTSATASATPQSAQKDAEHELTLGGARALPVMRIYRPKRTVRHVVRRVRVAAPVRTVAPVVRAPVAAPVVVRPRPVRTPTPAPRPTTKPKPTPQPTSTFDSTG
jgi:hypothetical protein